jgi:glycosyltransferase involved in cell wall biosynthesis
MEPLVSIIIPFYKGEKLISETLESLFAQDYSNMEIIVVDDGSPTESLISLELYKDRITLISQKNSGQAVARNVGIAVSHGSIIALLDQDDIWPAGRLKNTLSYLTPESPYGFIRGLTKAFQILPDGTRLSSDPTLLPVLVGAALYKRETIDIVGPLTQLCERVVKISTGIFALMKQEFLIKKFLKLPFSIVNMIPITVLPMKVSLKKEFSFL